MSWEEQAACRGVDADAEGFFYPLRLDKAAAAAALNAISICRTCPVLDQCLAEARAWKDSGVRGGVLRLAPGSKTGHKELDEHQLRSLVAGTFYDKSAEEGAA